ncbi:hypothetical protein VVT58_01450 [Sphingobium sp. SJ10-10]|uniref:hypothetical protein n=1 Tax=Sphingobium sp. SJ10-10 TaxID=3114999 RepID=UPI002E18449C|nr:hypothetical protein [Sphingobium sp. SJ10-10]
MEAQTFSVREMAAVIAIGAVGGCTSPLQPMLLGALLAAHKISPEAMGHAATAEALGMVLGTALASAYIPPRRLKWLITIALAVVFTANSLTIMLGGAGIQILRGFCGLGNSVLLWLFLSMLARSDTPTRLYAAFFLTSASLIFLLSMSLSAFALDRFGPNAGYIAFLIIEIILLFVVRLAPDRYAEIQSARGAAVPPVRGLLGLFSITLYLTGVTAFWLYSVPLGSEVGIPVRSMQMIVSAATGVQIVAGLAAMTLAAKLKASHVVVFTAIGGLAAALTTMTSGNIFIWAPAILIFAFCWMFAPPFHVAFLISVDPSRRAALFVGTAQLTGFVVGPLIASAMISSSDFAPARLVTFVCYCASLTTVAIIHLTASHAPPATTNSELQS